MSPSLRNRVLAVWKVVQVVAGGGVGGGAQVLLWGVAYHKDFSGGTIDEDYEVGIP